MLFGRLAMIRTLIRLLATSLPALLVGLAAAIVWPNIAHAAASEVKGLRVWQAPDNTRVVLDLSGPAEFSVTTLSGPDRLLIDLKTGKLGINLDTLSIDSKLVSKARTSTPPDTDTLRLVLDLAQPVEPHAFALKPFQQYGDRLVIDLKDKSQKKPQPIIEVPSTDENRDVIIAVDAGHGGDDPGASGPKGTREKDVTLTIAKRLAEKINATTGMKAVLTRSGDYFVPHRKRTSLARDQRADLFISIHADGFKDKRAAGSSVWVLSHRGAQSEMGRWLEEKESASELLGGEDALSLANYDDDVAKVLLDLSMYNAVGSSLDIGSSVLKEIKGVVPKLHSKRVQQAGFLVLKNPDIPSILVETAFISNPNEEALLKDAKHQDKLTQAIVDGVKGYFEQRPPEGSRFAQVKRSKHVITSGDTLADLASRYKVSVQDLKERNALKTDQLLVGQVLMIP
jgi:N-acetylmuramoyl-L-alanine amidase